MNYSFEILEGHIVRTTYEDEMGQSGFWDIYLENVFWGGKITFEMPVDENHKDRILWIYDLSDDEFATTGEYRAKGPSTGCICVYTNMDSNIICFVMYTNRTQMYRKFIHFSHRKEKIGFTKNSFKLKFQGTLFSEKINDFKVEKIVLKIDDNHSYDVILPFGKNKEYSPIMVEENLESIISQETQINNPIHIEVYLEDIILLFNVGHKTKRKEPSKYYFLPLIYTYYKNKALFVRGNVNQNYTLVVRDRAEIEYDKDFLRLEKPIRSRIAYFIGNIKRKHNKKPINLYYEKDSMKAEEGTFEVFLKASEKCTSENYFILDSSSPQWDEISKYPNVIAKYSKKYYELLYRANGLISTETNSHLNVHRAINPYVRRALLDARFIFLQHGVTYLKRQGDQSVFVKGKEGEPEYIVVGSVKEAQIVSDMLKIPLERCLKMGLPIFDTIEHEHINNESKDIVTIMLTWKPYEEHMITHFEDSSYYQNVIGIYHILSDLLPKESIRIVPHPKVLALLMATPIKEMVWQGQVSEVLAQTKLMITDYSSVCYNVFYQGSAVVFFQPEKEEYEQVVGKLIPRKNEYIGELFYDIELLKQCMKENIVNGQICLERLRNNEFVNRYKHINEFSDGKNVERIVEFLSNKKII